MGAMMRLKKTKVLAVILLAGGYLGVLLAPGVEAAKKGGSTTTSSTTAQSIWTNFKAAGNTFGFVDNETYEFNDADAVNYFDLVITGPVATCTAGGQGNINCADSNKPSAPSQPAQPAFELTRGDTCAFWAGSDLSTVSKTAATQVNGTNGSGKWTFTWTFTWTPQVVHPRTNWDLVESSTGEGATVTFNGQIAGLSALSTSRVPRKYSFGITNSDGSSRVTNIQVSVNGVSFGSVSSTVINASSPDFGEFGVGTQESLFTLMASSGALNILATGDARQILNGDDFVGNDNGGSGGSSLAYAQLDAVRLTLGEGTQSVTLTANVKGIDGNADLNISVTRSVRIQGLGSCG
jgi:hypothetical protein